jgi:hypothetical protein
MEPVSPPRLLLRALAAALLVLAVLRPPETYAWSGATCAVLLAAAATVASVVSTPAGLLPAWTAWYLPLAAGTLGLAACRARAVDEAALAAGLVLAAFLGGAIASDRSGREVVARVLVALGCVAAVLAILQAHVTYRQELRTLLEGGEAIPPYMLARLRDGRPAGPFALPAALGGFFALTLPLTLMEARSRALRGARAGLAGAVILQSYALFLTRSVGGLAATALSVSLSLPSLAPRATRRLLAAVAVVGLAVGVFFVVARRQEVTAPGGNPLLLRAGNWRVAAEMIHDHPLFGTGPGSFGAFYPRYMRAGMNETRYAHNTYLQVVAGWGAWAIVPLLALLLAFGRRIRAGWRRGDGDLPFVAAAGSFLAHNLCDFTAYLPGVALPGALLVGLALRPAAAEPAARGRAGWTRAAVLAAGLVVFAGQSLLSARAAVPLAGAREAALEGNAADALALARGAVRSRPSDPAPRAFVAEWVLAHGMDDVALRAEGRREAESAVGLDPQSAILHYDLSQFLRADREIGAAYREISIAHALFPLKEEYGLADVARAGGPTP